MPYRASAQNLTTPNQDYLNISGRIQAVIDAQIHSKVMARATKVLVKTGDKVEAGQLLIEFDNRSALANVAAIQAELSALDARKKWVDLEYARTAKLFAKQSVAAAMMDKISSEKNTLAANIRMAKAKLRAAKTMLDDYQIRAPFAAVVGSKNISAGSTANIGQNLLWLYQDDALRVEVALSAASLSMLDLQKDMLGSDEHGRFSIAASGIQILPSIDPTSGQILIRAALPKIAHVPLRSVGKIVDIKLALASNNAASPIFIKTCNIIKRNEISAVYLQNNQQKTLRLVRVGKVLDGFSEILAGLDHSELGDIVAGAHCEQ